MVSFRDAAHIADRQIEVALRAWLQGETPAHDLTPQHVVHGTIDGWQERLIISVNMTWPDSIVDGIRAFRDSVHEKIAKVFQFYQMRGEKEKDFGYWFAHEQRHAAAAIPLAASNYAARVKEMLSDGAVDVFKLQEYRSRGYDTFRRIHATLQDAGITREQMKDKIDAFLSSEAFKNVPANRIGCLMWAAIAHQAANGRTTPPNQGMSNDIDVVSTLLPYCDAMLVDRECAALLKNLPRKFPLGFDTAIFSPANRAAFLDYLHSIETTANRETLAAVVEVYGDKWLTPFRAMYKAGRREEGESGGPGA